MPSWQRKENDQMNSDASLLRKGYLQKDLKGLIWRDIYARRNWDLWRVISHFCSRQPLNAPLEKVPTWSFRLEMKSMSRDAARGLDQRRLAFRHYLEN